MLSFLETPASELFLLCRSKTEILVSRFRLNSTRKQPIVTQGQDFKAHIQDKPYDRFRPKPCAQSGSGPNLKNETC